MYYPSYVTMKHLDELYDTHLNILNDRSIYFVCTSLIFITPEQFLITIYSIPTYLFNTIFILHWTELSINFSKKDR